MPTKLSVEENSLPKSMGASGVDSDRTAKILRTRLPLAAEEMFDGALTQYEFQMMLQISGAGYPINVRWSKAIFRSN